MTGKPRPTLTGTDIDAPDADALADFYPRLLGWEAAPTNRLPRPRRTNPFAFFSVSCARYGVAR